MNIYKILYILSISALFVTKNDCFEVLFNVGDNNFEKSLLNFEQPIKMPSRIMDNENLENPFLYFEQPVAIQFDMMEDDNFENFTFENYEKEFNENCNEPFTQNKVLDFRPRQDFDGHVMDKETLSSRRLYNPWSSWELNNVTPESQPDNMIENQVIAITETSQNIENNIGKQKQKIKTNLYHCVTCLQSAPLQSNQQLSYNDYYCLCFTSLKLLKAHCKEEKTHDQWPIQKIKSNNAYRCWSDQTIFAGDYARSAFIAHFKTFHVDYNN